MAPDKKRAGELSPAFSFSTLLNKQFTKAKTLCNNLARYCSQRLQIMEVVRMIALAAAGAFLGLFTLWVVLPRKIAYRNDE